jgi:5-methylcytosine-specific restriction protein B
MIVDKYDKKYPVLELIERYKTYVKESQLKDELYKWRLINVFNGRPDTSAPDFTAELTSINFSNLIYPLGIGVIQHIAKEKPESLRKAFIKLFDENEDLAIRISFFGDETLKLYREIYPDNKHSHHQDERTIATYLAFHDSLKYALYKDSFYQKYCKLIGVKPKGKGEKYIHYQSLINDFVDDYILEDSDLLDIKSELLTEDCFTDINNKIFAQDILYSTLDCQRGMSRSYWRIGTSDDDNNYWEVMKENEYVSIGWPDIGDLSESAIQSKNDIIELFKVVGYYPDDKKVASRKAGEIFNFFNEMKEGDIVLAQDGEKILGIGEVIGDYGYVSSEGFPHYKPVDWKIFNPEFKNSEGLRTTVYKIQQPDIIQKIENLLKIYKYDTKMAKEIKITNELNQILFGPPGTGKTYNTINKALELCGEDLTTLSRCAIKELYEQKVNDGRIVFTTFHQSMTYEDFVEGIKPVEPKKEGDPVIYRVQEGIFRRLCSKASLNNEEPFVLIIDEINRGNVSQIFGELITLIEDDKRLGKAEAIQVQLPYSKKWFGVPSNVYIIGTMNTADRSVEALDTALRRRFSFVEIVADYKLIRTEGKAKDGLINGIDLANLLNLINKRIEKLLGKDHIIGHSYFLTISTLSDLKTTFHNKIIPLLQEYFYGDYGKIGLIIGQHFFEIPENRTEDDFFAPFNDYDSSSLLERRVYHVRNVLDMKDEDFILAINSLMR